MEKIEMVNAVVEEAREKHKVLFWLSDHLDAILTFGGGVCILAAALTNMHEGNSYVYANSADGDVYKIRAKKCNAVKGTLKHAAEPSSVEEDK